MAHAETEGDRGEGGGGGRGTKVEVETVKEKVEEEEEVRGRTQRDHRGEREMTIYDEGATGREKLREEEVRSTGKGKWWSWWFREDERNRKKKNNTRTKRVSALKKKHGSYLWLDFLPTLFSSHELLVTVVLSALMKRQSQRGQKKR